LASLPNGLRVFVSGKHELPLPTVSDCFPHLLLSDFAKGAKLRGNMIGSQPCFFDIVIGRKGKNLRFFAEQRRKRG
jgi:hypothetical protein